MIQVPPKTTPKLSRLATELGLHDAAKDVVHRDRRRQYHVEAHEPGQWNKPRTAGKWGVVGRSMHNVTCMYMYIYVYVHVCTYLSIQTVYAFSVNIYVYILYMYAFSMCIYIYMIIHVYM